MSIETFPDKVHRVFKEITGCIGTEPLDPLIVAGHSLAQAIDDAAYIQDKPYHNSQHTCEVMLSSYFISLLGGLNKQETAEIVLAALIHDFQHDGKFNGDILFRLERSAVNEAAPYLSAAKMPLSQQKKIAALILATEIFIGGDIAHASHTYHNHGGTFPDIPSAAPELREICEDPAQSIQALILCEADILPSIGLTTDYAFRLQEKLAMEWGMTLGLEDKLRFIDTQCHAFIIGHFFNPNIDKLRLEILRRLH
jgi:hypothetical protein